eukprot:CAMPEP_0115189164 /NCGR_PEP_ID=MMETSP0270-20121206/11379_1 /TAXON_ID=71861 /ORGANISM="Scrippsiella trochoidea, Strain CCMP3099" /LENGTH=110 /DNA_ID=CAMNT_0002602357 /DNA_START=981 /DNA_END=1313 /DNA_ORIENTATION=+
MSVPCPEPVMDTSLPAEMPNPSHVSADKDKRNLIRSVPTPSNDNFIPVSPSATSVTVSTTAVLPLSGAGVGVGVGARVGAGVGAGATYAAAPEQFPAGQRRTGSAEYSVV